MYTHNINTQLCRHSRTRVTEIDHTPVQEGAVMGITICHPPGITEEERAEVGKFTGCC